MAFLVRKSIDDSRRCAMRVDVVTPYGILPQGRVEALAVVDTGSPATLIRADLAARLHLPAMGTASILQASSAARVDCFTTLADLVLLGDEGRVWTFEQPLVVAPDLVDVGLILGMDCFDGGSITIHFVEGWWCFRVPPAPEV